MRWIVVAAVLAPWFQATALEAAAPRMSVLTADQVVEKNVAARGGLEAWRKIQTMIWIGHVETSRGALPSVPFVMQLKRPNKTRFEVDSMGERTVRAFDGQHGWKVKPARNGDAGIKPYTQQEVTFAFRAQLIDGPLIDYQAKGNKVELEGVDEVEGHRAYRLKVELASGETDHVWVDAGTFLDLRYDRPSYGSAGAPATVSLFYRDYKTIDDVQIPGVVETGAGPGQTPDRMVIDRIMLNPAMDDRTFVAPGGPGGRGGVAMSPRSGRTLRQPPNAPSATSGASAPDRGSAANPNTSSSTSDASTPVPGPGPK
jgi:outer membrane lipoprotein-sorting protein